jgi:DNA-binding transcriptional MerR regulator
MRIQEVSQETGLSIHALRYYEQIGLVLPVARQENGHRYYSEDDVYRIVFVTHLRAAGMPIADIKRYVELANQGDSTVLERLELLEQHRELVEQKIEDLHHHLELISNKIAHYHEYYRQQLEQQQSDID